MKISRRQALIATIFGTISLWCSDFSKFLNHKINIANAVSQPDHPTIMSSLSPISNRVISVHSPGATNWDGQTYPYVDSINYPEVQKMLEKGLQELTSQNNSADAWRELFSTYKHGDRIAIKPNFNDLYNEFKNNLVVSPAVINAIVNGLIRYLNVPPGNIIIYDCTRKIPNAFRKRIHSPVKYVEAWASSLFRKFQYKLKGNHLAKADEGYEIRMTHDIKDGQGRPIKCYLPKVITMAQHIINVPIFKSHQFVLASGALKNHYGTVRFSNGITGPQYLHPPVIHESIVDVNNHPQLREKTRLIVADALFGRLKKKGGPPDKWQVYKDGNPNRLFLSRNPVAIDSVTSNIIRNELKTRNEEYFSNTYLKLSAHRGLGIFEDPIKGPYKQIDFQEISV